MELNGQHQTQAVGTETHDHERMTNEGGPEPVGVGEQVGAPVTDRQHIDIQDIRNFFSSDLAGREDVATFGVLPKDYLRVRTQVLELLDLVENSGFLRDVEQARTDEETKQEELRQEHGISDATEAAAEQEGIKIEFGTKPEEVLPSIA